MLLTTHGQWGGGMGGTWENPAPPQKVPVIDPTPPPLGQ